MHRSLFLRSLAASTACLLVACSADNGGSGFQSGGSEGSGAAGSGGSGVGGGIGPGAGGFGPGSGGGGGEQVSEVFGHGPDQLYRLDPVTKEVTVVGTFQGCSGVIDIAADKDSQLYGTTSGGLYRIDRTTAVCTQVSSGSYPNSLSFVPAGTVDPNAEALVGYNGASYVRIDTQTGAVHQVGMLSGSYASSGDIVSVKGGKTLLTVKGGPSFGCNDCLLEVDPTSGDLLKEWGAVGDQDVFGLAFWAGSAYAFSNGGLLWEITFGTDTVTATPITIPNAPGGLQFWGAGSTTSAPPLPVPE